MQKNRGLTVVLILAIVSVVAGIKYFKNDKSAHSASLVAESNPIVEESIEPIKLKDRVEEIAIVEGSTYGELMATSGVSVLAANEIYNATYDDYDLAKIRVGKSLELRYDAETNELKQLVYKIDSEDELLVNHKDYYSMASSSEPIEKNYYAQVQPINYEVRIAVKEGTVKTSMYVAALDNEIDERAVIELANAFQWSIDFAMDPRVDDEFRFVYEERYLNGEYKMPGKILAGEYINKNKKYQVYYFEDGEEVTGYYDENGNSVQKMFLKAPVAFKYISSGFTTGLRYVEAFNVSTGHRAIDYAAPIGTPIRAVGDGTVTFAGWNGGYGNMMSVRHNGTYQTNYAHLSRYALRKGAKVKQGDIIGYVGSTGFSTGPHLHYEMVKNGLKINPLAEVLPPGKPINEDSKEKFEEEKIKYQKMLGLEN